MKSKGYIILAVLAGIGFAGGLLLQGPYADEAVNSPLGDITQYVGIMTWVCFWVMIACIIIAVIMGIVRSISRAGSKITSGITRGIMNAVNSVDTTDRTPKEVKYKVGESNKPKPDAEKPASEKRTCSYCGSTVENNAKNCSNCGAPLQ